MAPASRPRRGVLGLRGRIVGALLVTAVATLGVAALTLLGPLEQGLRDAALKTLGKDVRGEAGRFRSLQLDFVTDSGPGDPAAAMGLAERKALSAQQTALARRTGGTVTLLGYPDISGRGHPLLPSAADTTESDPYDDVSRAFLTGRTLQSLGSIDGTELARVAIPIQVPIQIGTKSQPQTFVLAVRKPIDEVRDAVAAVRTAFITAALAGLALTLILGVPLAATLGRRLRRLREAALRLAGGRAPVEFPVDRAHDEVGDLSRAFAIMQGRLQHQEQARRAFVATASHELRTPLTSLDGMLELLDEDLRGETPDIDDARGLLGRARAQSRRLGRLASDLLDLSRLDAEVALRSEAVELGELSRAVLAEFELGTAERGITSTIEAAPGPVWALGDPGSVAQILRILLDNAVDASPEGSEVTVALRAGKDVTLSVRDLGPGVEPGERELIFERFQRGRATGAHAGFGLGLAIGRELAQRMGGELVLDSHDAPGATFTLRLPGTQARDRDAVAPS